MATGCFCVLVPFPPLSSRRCEVDKYYLKKVYSFLPSALCGHLPILTKHPRKPFSQREFSFTYLSYLLTSYRTVVQIVPVGDSTCASGAHPRTNCGAGCRYPFATDHGGNAVFFPESYGRTDRGYLHSPDSRGNFRVCVIRQAFHLSQILRAHATRSQVSSALLGSSSSSHPQACDAIPRPMRRISSELDRKRCFTARTQGACSQQRCGESPRAKLQRVSSDDRRTPVCGQAVKQSAEMRSALEFATAQSCRKGCQAYKNEVYLLQTELD